MSQLGGFNFVFQIRRDKLLDLIQEKVTVQGNRLATPFRLVLQGPVSGPPPRRLNTVGSACEIAGSLVGDRHQFLQLEVGTRGWRDPATRSARGRVFWW